ISEARSEHEIDVTVLFVPSRFVRAAALEAVEARIPHIHILAEGVPYHDSAHILAAADEAGVMVIGPNSQGMLSAGKAKLGATGGPDPSLMFKPGPVGILSRSGGMGAEVAHFLTRHDIGQSTYVSIGGDLLIGTGFTPLLEKFQADPETGCVFIFGEAGTGHEEAVAEMLAQKRFAKPLIAMVVGDGLAALPKGMSFGHTGTLIARGEGDPFKKKEMLREAGAHVVSSFDELLDVTRDIVAQAL
ncbi:MAG TPA: succinate--CoA ligase subunit alpha, partial [Rhodospirillaceae bacterium]|nr:succinate--CoA ligase subunit alpha [Rhodospirillaceae bacterium]